MSKGNATENDLLAYIFNATAIPWNGISSLYVALHTADPGESGDQTTNEVSYTGYSRVAVDRDSGGWTVSGNQAVNTAAVIFGACTGGIPTATHVSVGTAASGAGQILYSGALGSPRAISPGVTPQFAIGALLLSED